MRTNRSVELQDIMFSADDSLYYSYSYQYYSGFSLLSFLPNLTHATCHMHSAYIQHKTQLQLALLSRKVSNYPCFAQNQIARQFFCSVILSSLLCSCLDAYIHNGRPAHCTVHRRTTNHIARDTFFLHLNEEIIAFGQIDCIRNSLVKRKMLWHRQMTLNGIRNL